MNNKIKVFESFSGIGAVSKALKNIKVNYELVGFSEIDKYAIKSFCEIHKVSENLNYGNICNIDEKKLPYFDLYTFGSPCQDFSVAGKQEGAKWNCCNCNYTYNPLDINHKIRNKCPKCKNKNINKTRSSLVVESMRIIKYKKPKYLLMENVKNLVSKQFKPSFDKIINELNEYGYNTYYEILNSKNYGVPQNRERVFLICIRKDIDNNRFQFPKGFYKGIKLNDLLEENVEERYYLSDEIVNTLVFSTDIFNKDIIIKNKIDIIGTLNIKGQDNIKRVYNSNGISPTLTNMQGGNRQPKIFENNLQFVGAIGNKNLLKDNKQYSRNYPQGNRVYNSNGISCSQTAQGGGIGGKTGLYLVPNYRIRKLTPLECWRLMGFNDIDFYKVKNLGMSNTQI